MKKVILIVICLLVTITGAQAMNNSPPTIELSGNAGEYLNATIYFSDVPTDTLMGYEKWTTDGKTLNRSLKASDLGIELIYPMVVEVDDGKAAINISVRAENAGNYTGAIFYRTSGQTGIAAGTWIKISVADNSTVTKEESFGVWQSLCNVWQKFWSFIIGFFPTAEASNITMNTSVSVVSAPTSQKVPGAGGGGGGGNLQRDTDRDGICDWFEEIRGTDPNDPCDPNPNCAACLATKPSPTPIEAPKPSLVTQKKIPSRPEPVVIPPLEPEKKPSLLFYGFCIALVGAGVVFLIYRLRKRDLENGEEEEEIEGEIEDEVYWE